MKKLSLSGVDKVTRAVKSPRGAVIEASTWGEEGAVWGRGELRSDTKSVVPVTIEGVWFARAVIKAMAQGKIRFSFDDAGLKKAAKALDKQLDKVRDLYDS